MTLAGAALAAALACGPAVSSDTMSAIVGVESGGDALAIHDNSTGRAYHPRDVSTAIELSKILLARGHSVDLGLAQVNSVHLGAGVTVESLLEPCGSVRTGSAILEADYAAAAARWPDRREALFRAIGAYNSGSVFAGDAYARLVVREVVIAPVVPSISILTGNDERRPAARNGVRLLGVGRSQQRPTSTQLSQSAAIVSRRAPVVDVGFGVSGSKERPF